MQGGPCTEKREKEREREKVCVCVREREIKIWFFKIGYVLVSVFREKRETDRQKDKSQKG